MLCGGLYCCAPPLFDDVKSEETANQAGVDLFFDDCAALTRQHTRHGARTGG